MWGPWRTGPSISSSRTASSSRTRGVARNELRRWSEPAAGLVPLARGQGYSNALFATSHGSSRFICGPRFSASATALRPTSLLLCSHHRRETLASGGDSVAPPASSLSQPPSPPSAASQRKEYTAELLRSIARRGGGAVRRARHGTPTSAAGALSALLNPSSVSAKSEASSNGGGASARAAASVKGAEQVAAGSPLLRVFDATHAPRPTAPPRPAEPKAPSSAGPIANRRSGAEAPRTRRNANSSASVFTAGSTAGGGAPSSVPPPASRPTPPPRALLHKLLHTIRTEKRVPWDALSRLHPELLHMPLYAYRHEWCEGYCARGSATPIFSLSEADSATAPPLPASSLTTTATPCGGRSGHRRRLPPLLLCAASTGTGKSVLIPLYALDAHWAVLERRLLRTIDAYDKAAAAEATEKVRGGVHSAHDTLLSATTAQQTAAAAAEAEAEAEAEAAHVALRPFPLDSQESFIREFTACSRLRIVVSQPTRVACAELAAYASALLDAGRTCVGASYSSEVAPAGAGLSGGRRRDKKQCALSRRLVGKRVGFAVGGESQFCSETEIVFATPGYVLNALQVSHPQSSLSPTTLVVDEAHCRDIETDALLAWMKLSRECSRGGDASALAASASLPVLRQYYVVSATMNLQAMDAYLCRGLQNGSNGERDAHPGPREGLARGPKRTIAESDALPEDAGGTGTVSADAPLLLLSPMQRHHVRRWWRRDQSLGAGGRSDGADVDSAVARAATTDQRVRAAVLQLVEATEGYGECDDGYCGDPLLIGGAASVASGSPAASSTETTARMASSRLSPPLTPSEPRGADGAVIVIATQPHRVERYFVDDLDPVKGCFARSQVLFDEAARLRATAAASAAAARTPSNAMQGRASGGRKGGSQPKQGGRAASSASAAEGTQRSSRGFPMCLTDDGAALRARLIDLHGMRAASYVMLNTHARALVELILQLLQAARLRWIDGAAAPPAAPRPPRSEQSYHADDIASEPVSMTLAAAAPPAADAPITVLVFVAGISELHQIMLALERLCDTVQPSPSTASFPSANVADSSAPSTLVLRHGSEVFSVGLLHSTAVGSPQEQLTATEHSGAPLRLLLSTNVAESSLTIANTRIVVDTCLERRISTDDVTGATRVLTSFVSPSGLRQRCGRVGRSGDGVAIHLAPRRFLLPETLLHPPPTTTTRRAVLPTSSAAGTSDSSASTLTFEPLPDGVATVLLRLKFLFAKVSDALAALPSPPSAAAVRLALQQLADMDLLLLPEAAETTPPQETTRNVPDLAARTTSTERGSLMEASAASASAAARGPFGPANAAALYSGDGALLLLLDCSTFTPKGYFVASLPLPYEHASLVYYGLQFCCVEDALLVACAMAVPSLFLTPRVSSRSAIQVGARRSTNSDYASQRWDVDRMPALSPLEQFYRHLWVQRHFAGFAVQRMVRSAACPSDGGGAAISRQSIDNSSSASDTDEPAPTTAAATTSAEGQAGQLSEPLMLRALLLQWYAFSNVDACIGFQNAHGLNRNAMRQVDSTVAQTCGRLIRLLLQLSTASEDGAAKRFVAEDAEAEVDFGAYVCQAGAAGSGTTVLPSTNGMPGRGSRGGGSTIGCIPFLPDWPAEAREQLLRSLRRLQRVAVSRVHLRHTEVRQRYGLPQWCDSEERWIRLWGRPYLRHGPTDHLASRTGGRGAGEISAGVLDKERDAREAVQRHPCFTYWVNGLPALRSPYPSLYRQQPTTSVAVGGAITPFSTSAPPPLSTQVTRSKVPIYRPPVSPPPIPPVVFAMGRTDDRLCAAFVAAFGHRTLRGEDGGHRFHHRRLRRNMQALANDEEHVCTFHIDVQQQQQQQQQELASPSLSSGGAADQPTRTAPLSPPSNSYDLLHASGVTSKSVEQALSPYLRGAGLQQLEVFQSNRLAVAARFASDGFSGLFDSLSPSHPVVLCANGDADNNADEEGDGGGDAASMQRVHAVRDGQRTAARGTRSAEARCGVATSEAAPTNTRPVSADGAHGPPSEDLLRAVVLPSALRYADGGRPPPPATSPARDNSPRRSHPYVQLAPFGVSLLTAATAGTGGGGVGSGLGSLQRIPLSGAATAALASPAVPAQPSSSLTAVPTLPSASLARQAGSAADKQRSVRFAELPLPSAAAATRPTRGGAATATATTTACVAWSDSLGSSSRSVTRAAVAALGLADLFPTAPPLSKNSSPLDSRGTPLRTNSGDDTAAASAPSSACTSSQPSNGTATPTTLTVSVVPPIYVTRSITWKVLLPALVPPASSRAQATHKGSTDAAPPPAHYCVLCNHLCSGQGALDQHYRSVSHLEHLYRAVQLGLRREHLATLYGWSPPAASGHRCAGTDDAHTRDHPGFSESEGSASTLHLAPPANAAWPLASLLSLQSATRLPLAQHVYPCVVGAQSFLNCLQWSAGDPAPSSSSLSSSQEAKRPGAHKVAGRAAGAHRATPLAVAGSLVALQSVADVLPPPHLRKPTQPSPCCGGAGVGAAPPSSSVDAETLSAHHVWVLNLSNSSEVSAAAARNTSPPMSALLVVAGYLAAASPQAAVALLLNGTHTHLHAVMLYGLGVWRLPTPLPMQGYMGLLEHIGRGGGWLGVLVPMTSDPSYKRHKSVREEVSPATHGPSDGLHWCAPEAACALSSDNHRCNMSASARALDRDAIVEATLLLVLHEYLHARRNMVTLADYVERVMHKLQLSPFVVPGARAVRGAGQASPAVTAADVLTAYLTHVRRGQSVQALLRDLGCGFATPPRALATLMRPASASTPARTTQGSWRGAPTGLGEGRSREAPVSPAAALAKQLSYRALGAEGAAVEMMFTVPPALPSRLPPVTFAAQLRQFYVDRHVHRWAPQRQASATPTRTGDAAAITARAGDEVLIKGKPHARPARALQARDRAGRLRGPRKVDKGIGIVDDEENLPQF